MISDTIKNRIENLYYTQRRTQEEVAAMLNVRQSTINPLLSGRQSYSGLKIATVEKMFPKASINLDGDAVSNAFSNITNSKVNSDNNILVGNRGGVVDHSLDAARGKMYKTVVDCVKLILSQDMPAEAKVQLLNGYFADK
ncbi:MAG: hypothetical protein IIW10_05455 [Spirochaetaceae bacterium]|nr:hypothetical protein [Spirochaetaceae bacterium]